MASAPSYKPTLDAPYRTRSEQRLEWLEQQRGIRRLTDEEWREVTRCEHAIYCLARKRA